MQIALFGMHVLEVMFFVGLAGSTIVVLISFVEDAKELSAKTSRPAGKHHAQIPPSHTSALSG